MWCVLRNLAGAACVLAAFGGRADAQMSGGAYSLASATVTQGGTWATGGPGGIYTLEATISQPGGVGTSNDENGDQAYSGYAFTCLGAVASVSSIVTHGTAGSFALPPGGMNPIEPRRTTGFTFEIRFLALMTSKDALDPAQVELLDDSETPQSWTATGLGFVGGGTSGTALQVAFSNNGTLFPFKKVYTVDMATGDDLRIVTSTGLRAKRTHGIRNLVGDVNQDGMVDTSDVGAIKSVNRRAVTANPHETSGIPMFLYDVNSDGRINLIDAGLARSEWDD